MKKKGLISILLAMFLIAFTGSAFAWSPSIEGKPDQFVNGGPKGYYIWHDDHGFHIWTSTLGREHVFSGVIHTDGRLYNIKGHHLEDGDTFKVSSDPRENAWFKFSEGDGDRGHFSFGGREVGLEHDKIHFKFNTAGGSDGLNFRIKDASYVDFDLFIDGRPVPRREIHIGDNGWHPDHHNFKLYK
jgi:hypothetical protein